MNRLEDPATARIHGHPRGTLPEYIPVSTSDLLHDDLNRAFIRGYCILEQNLVHNSC